MSTTPHRIVQEQQHWVDRSATWCADRCSPILVKESRQAMKSWQFQGTFLLLLLFVVGWSFLAVSLTLYEGMEESGGVLLAGYLWILGFPLAIVLPLAAFRSLAREFEDETIQLISITTMSARRIVLGKLGSSVLQMIVYLAAVVPCLAFSYILRGVDLTQIFQLLALAVVGSLGLVCVGLMLAGFARFGWLAVVLNLGLLVLTGILYMMWCSFNGFVGQMGLDAEMQFGILFVIGLAISTGYLAFECAVSLISFPSEDRSSRIRLAVTGQVLVFSVVFVALVTDTRSAAWAELDEFFCYLSAWISHYLCLVGAMMVSEQPGLSQRVRRSLPKSLVGRIVWGLYLPGPGRGYLYTLVTLWSWNLAIGLMLTLGWPNWIGFDIDAANLFDRWICLLLNMGFGTIYVSLVYLFLLLVGPSIRYGRILAGLLLVVILYAVVAVICTSADAFLYRNSSYYMSANEGFAQRFNWPIVFSRAVDGTASTYTDVTISLGLFAGALTLLCGYWALKEWVVSPVMVPQRVQEETRRQTTTSGPIDPLSADP